MEVPINTRKRFDSTKDGRHWGTLRENKRSGFNGDQYIDTYRDSFECHDENFPYLVQFKKVNRRQFNLKTICESCGHHSKRTLCEEKKFWEFPLSEEKVSVKHFGQHSCSPVSSNFQQELAETVKKYPAKGVSGQQGILCSSCGELKI